MATGLYIPMGGARNPGATTGDIGQRLGECSDAGLQSQETVYRQIHNDATALGNPNQAMGLPSSCTFPSGRSDSLVMDERYTKFNQGALKKTGNDLDIALTGEVFSRYKGRMVQCTREMVLSILVTRRRPRKQRWASGLERYRGADRIARSTRQITGSDRRLCLRW